MLWEEHKIMGNTEICPPRHQLFVTQGLLDLEVVVLEKKKKKESPCRHLSFILLWKMLSWSSSWHWSSWRWRAVRQAVPLQLSVAVTQCPRVTQTGHEQRRTAQSLNVISEHRKGTW